MDVLILAPQPFFIERGTPIAVRNLATALAKQGHHIDLLVFPGGKQLDINGVDVHRIPHLGFLSDIGPGFSIRKLIADIVMLPKAATLIRRGRHDLVIAVEESAYIALVLRRFFGVPYICDIDSSIPEQLGDKFNLPSWLVRLFERAEGRAARGAIGAITCCRALADITRAHAPDLPIQTLEDIPLTDDAPSLPVPEDCQFDVPVIMYVGNLEAYQGVDLLLDGFAAAVAKGAIAQLVIIGGAPAHISALRERAQKLGITAQVSILGPRPVAQIGRYLAQATIVASPRTKGRNTPMKVYSYLDSGRPLLATRLPTHTQVLDDDIAMLVDPDAASMARGITALIDDPSLRSRLANAAQIRVQSEFSRPAFERKLSRFMTEKIMPQIGMAQPNTRRNFEPRPATPDLHRDTWEKPSIENNK
ncbi:glycosyltransferase family 4 protein [Loktanella sp. F6476L]|uniref:glycosyltransferase family 4 protein n=1 Tax=Loktanella sp. F6476L TaxID=2926405 RepID=UPI001FF6539D|nr:glycosyltransferase family 4 protein [Loktanella sp. F6476L]MCK0122675.1 glycosyltransferase family 4 protein [Loktanella sp. F6476L]